jgi:hypothetical protein
MMKAGLVSLDGFSCLDQFRQTNQLFPGSPHATREPYEMQARPHDGFGVVSSTACNNPHRLSSLHDLALSAPGELVEGRFEGALFYFLARMGFFYRLKSSCRGDIWVALLEFPDRRRQIDTWGPLGHCLTPF